MMRTIPIMLVALATVPPLVACQRGGLPPDGPPDGQFVVDAVGLIEDESEQRMNETLGAVLDDTDIELLTVTIEDFDGAPISDFTNTLFERWQVGRRTRANRGVLLVIGRDEGQVRLEVAYDLESIFTDAFVSYIEHEQLVPYFENEEIGHGVEATVELVARRAYEGVLGQAYDPTAAGDSDIGGFRSGGAGAETDVTVGAGIRSPRPAADDEVRSHFAAQATPELAWQRFVEANRRRIKDPDLGIYDAEARQFMRGVVSNAGQDHIADLYDGERASVRTRGDRAVILFLSDADHLLAPWFFHQMREGWQLDGSMYPDVIGYNHLNQWRFRRRDHPYMFAFSEFRLDKNGFVFYDR